MSAEEPRKTPTRCSRCIYVNGVPSWCLLPGNHPGEHRTEPEIIVEFGP